jgi:hypothetical protein
MRFASLYRKSAWVVVVAILFNFSAFGNMAPPGFWDAGHGSAMLPLFRSDSGAVNQVQMQQEQVWIDLYPNYAVVKGTYWFYNHSNSIQRLHAGYPVNGSNYAELIDYVRFDDLYHLRVLVNGQEVATTPLWDSSGPRYNEVMDHPGLSEIDNWYVWEMSFAPKTVTRVEVYFLVKTPASLTRGGGRKTGNAFEYILQTGSAWRDQIEHGSLIVTLRGGLTIDDLTGIRPTNKVRYSSTQLFYSFSNLKPTAADDLIIWYEGSSDTSLVKLDPPLLYQQIDRTDTAILMATSLPVLEKNDFTTPAPIWVIIFIVATLVLLVGGWLVVRAIVKTIRRFRKHS